MDLLFKLPKPGSAVIVSACFLALAFQCSLYAGWLAGFFLVPLAWVVFAGGRFSWWHGVAWGALFWSVHTIGLCVMCVEHGAGMARFFMVPLFVAVSMIYSGCWFGGAQWVAHFFKHNVARAAVWLVWAWCYFVWMHAFAFSWLGQRCGYPFALPILPLAQYGFVVRSAGWLGMYGLLLAVLGMQLFFAYAYWANKNFFLWCGPIALALMGVHFLDKHERPLFLNTIGFVRPVHEKGMTSLDQAQAIDAAISHVRDHVPAITTVLMPESAFPFPLNEYQSARDLWAENCLADGQIRLIIGSYYREQERMFNCLFCLYKCRIILHYVKSSLMPFTECVPQFCKNSACINALFAQGKPFSPASCARNIFIQQTLALTKKIMVEPCLCSELFFDHVTDDRNIPILCLVNDSWFSCSYMRECMRLYAKLRACAMHRSIMYVGHYDAFYFSMHGDAWKIFDV